MPKTRFLPVFAGFRPTSGTKAATFPAHPTVALLIFLTKGRLTHSKLPYAGSGVRCSRPARDDTGRPTPHFAEVNMSNHLAIELFGLRGAADGPLAICVLAIIALAATRSLWWR